jgi:hypothetical protein
VQFEADAGYLGQRNTASADRQDGRRAVERVEGQRVDLGAAEAEGRDQVQAEQVAAVRPESAPRPPGGGGVSQGHVEGADRDTPFAVAAWFLAGHHDGPGPEGIEVGPVNGGDCLA